MHETARTWTILALFALAPPLAAAGCASSSPAPADSRAVARTQAPTEAKPTSRPSDDAESGVAIYEHVRSFIHGPSADTSEVIARIYADGRWERAVPNQGSVDTLRRGKFEPEALSDVRALFNTVLYYEERTKLCRAMPMFEHRLTVDGLTLIWKAPCSRAPSVGIKAMMREVESHLRWTAPPVPGK